MVLEREIKTYHDKLTELLPHKGKFVVIHGEQVVGIFDGFEDALRAGYERCGNEPFLVREIREAQTVLYSSRSVRPCPT